MTADALVVKSLLQVEPGLRTMASRATNTLIPFFEFILFQDIFSVFINMMAILTRESSFDMTHMGESHGRSCFSSPIQYDLVRLCLEGGTCQK
jgi:hypothetical protein